MSNGKPLLRVENLKTHFHTATAWCGRSTAFRSR